MVLNEIVNIINCLCIDCMRGSVIDTPAHLAVALTITTEAEH